MRLIYVGSPYSHSDPLLMEKRVDAVMHFLASTRRTSPDLVLYSPIVTWAQIANRHSLPHDFDNWMQHDFFMIRKASALWVLGLEGWRESYGLQQEMEFARDIKKEILYARPESVDLDGGPRYVLTSDEQLLP